MGTKDNTSTAFRDSSCVHDPRALPWEAVIPNFRGRLFAFLQAVSANTTQDGRWFAVLVCTSVVVFMSFIITPLTLADSQADRVNEMERLIDAVASRNKAPKLVGEPPSAYPIFSEQFDWNDQSRVRAAALALAQDGSNDLWGCLVEHFHDTRYSATCELDECYPENWTVGSVCIIIAENKLQCAYLRHLKPGGTSHYGGPTFNHVSEDTKEFLPDSVQRDLHYVPFLRNNDKLAAWYRARKGKPLFELQIEICEWAIKRAEDAQGAADKPKKKFVAAVRNEVESLKKNKKPSVDPSAWSSPMSDGFWKFYTKESSLWTRDHVLNRESQEKGKKDSHNCP